METLSDIDGLANANYPNSHDSRHPESLVVKKHSKSLIRMPTTGSCGGATRGSAQGSPEKIAASPLAPQSSELGTPKTSQHLDYQHWLNSGECYDDSIDGNRMSRTNARIT